VLTDFKVLKIAKEYLDGTEGALVQGGGGKRKVSSKNKFEVPIDKTIGDVFSYESNLVKVECSFTSVRELYILMV
jgi:hypothetical protein